MTRTRSTPVLRCVTGASNRRGALRRRSEVAASSLPLSGSLLRVPVPRSTLASFDAKNDSLWIEKELYEFADKADLHVVFERLAGDE